jgi:hypothetical protein
LLLEECTGPGRGENVITDFLVRITHFRGTWEKNTKKMKDSLKYIEIVTEYLLWANPLP